MRKRRGTKEEDGNVNAFSAGRRSHFQNSNCVYFTRNRGEVTFVFVPPFLLLPGINPSLTFLSFFLFWSPLFIWEVGRCRKHDSGISFFFGLFIPPSSMSPFLPHFFPGPFFALCTQRLPSPKALFSLFLRFHFGVNPPQFPGGKERDSTNMTQGGKK